MQFTGDISAANTFCAYALYARVELGGLAARQTKSATGPYLPFSLVEQLSAHPLKADIKVVLAANGG